MSHFFKYYFPALFWAALIFAGSSLPSDAIQSLGVEFDDLVLHAAEYAIFGFLLGRACVGSRPHNNLKLAALACVIGILYAASDEYHQSFVPGRFTEFSDFVADSFGVTLGLVVFSHWRRLLPKKLASRKIRQ